MQSIWRDSIVYSFAIILHRSLNFILVLLFVSGLSKANYGTYELYISILTFSSLIIALELAQGCGRLINEVNSLQKNMIFSMSFYTIIFLGLAFLTISSFGLLDSLWFYLFSEKIKIAPLFYAVVNIPFFALFTFLQIQLRWEFRRFAYLFSSLLPLFLFLLFISYLVIFLELSLSLLFLGNLIMNVLGCLISIYLLRTRFTLNFDFSLYKKILNFSLPFIPASILLIAILITDRFMLDWFLDRSQVGEYSFAYRISNIAVLTFAGIQSALSPLIMKYHDSLNFRKEFNNILHIFLTYSHIFLFGLLLLIPSFLNYFSTFQAYESSLVVLIYLIPALFLSQIYIFLPGPVIAKKTSVYIYVNLISFLANICLNFFLIPRFGLVGAAISTLITYVVSISLLLIFSRNFFMPSVKKSFFVILLSCWLLIFLLWLMPGVHIYSFSLFNRSLLYLIFSIIIIKASGFSPSSFIQNLKNFFYGQGS
jgi:O-antigen/teichoic acid export membrane protein